MQISHVSSSQDKKESAIMYMIGTITPDYQTGQTVSTLRIQLRSTKEDIHAHFCALQLISTTSARDQWYPYYT
uniref:Uncharacterized protein n=1 Tax=Arundo donax TaxID=35708 RepID=A0A0A9G2B7_ARUDO